METAVLALVGAAAVGYLLYKVWLSFSGKASCGCGSSSSCSDSGCSCSSVKDRSERKLP